MLAAVAADPAFSIAIKNISLAHEQQVVNIWKETSANTQIQNRKVALTQK